MPLPVSTSTQQPSQPQGTPDPYLTHFDPRSEHQSYKQAQMRLEEVHKEKVTKVSSIDRSVRSKATYQRALCNIYHIVHRYIYVVVKKGKCKVG